MTRHPSALLVAAAVFVQSALPCASGSFVQEREIDPDPAMASTSGHASHGSHTHHAMAAGDAERDGGGVADSDEHVPADAPGRCGMAMSCGGALAVPIAPVGTAPDSPFLLDTHLSDRGAASVYLTADPPPPRPTV